MTTAARRAAEPGWPGPLCARDCFSTALVSAVGGCNTSTQQGKSAEQGKYSLSVPGRLAFSEFRGYDGWQIVSIGQDGPLIAAVLTTVNTRDYVFTSYGER